jgi:hypothetical protein
MEHSESQSSNSLRINTAELPSGNYMLMVRTAQGENYRSMFSVME